MNKMLVFYYIVEMEVEHFDEGLLNKLKEKAQEIPTYRKSLGVLQSLQ